MPFLPSVCHAFLSPLLIVLLLAVASLGTAPATFAAEVQTSGNHAGREVGRGDVYTVVELSFQGPHQTPADAPARDIDFHVLFRHEDGVSSYRISGFWDGDGKGGSSGNVFKVRFCPTKPGRWFLAEVYSNSLLLNGQKQGEYVSTTLSKRKNHHGFWEVDAASPGKRWYRRSDGSHAYVFGNTMYTFLSQTGKDGRPSGNDIAADLRNNARYFRKVRFSAIGDRYPHPDDSPFFDSAGKGTYDGDQSFRPDPRWFHNRVDKAVQTSFDLDLIADLILSGVDLPTTRAALRAAGNNGDPGPYLKYMAARYGAYPNAWFCLINEFDLYGPIYKGSQVAVFGQTLRSYLPYPSPLSVHKSPGTWLTALNTNPSWNDHVTLQLKLKSLPVAADTIGISYVAAGSDKPVIDDELSYQGDGDHHTEGDTIESHLGAFLGGGYASTGYKAANKLGQYFTGNFDPRIHTTSESLRWLREQIDDHITFWRMSPDQGQGGSGQSIFRGNDDLRSMSWPEHEYVLGTHQAQTGLTAQLPPGTWTVTRYDVIARRTETIRRDASGTFPFDAPDSRAVLFHFKKNEIGKGERE